MNPTRETRWNPSWLPIPALARDLKSAQRLASGLSALADRIEGGAEPNPTALISIRNANLPEWMRLQYRAEWIRQLVQRRRGTKDSQKIDLLENAYALHIARLGHLEEVDLARHRDAALSLAQEIIQLQPGWKRLSHYCGRRTGPDPELIALEYFTRALRWRIDGTEDYLAAMYCVCRQPDLRFRLVPAAVPKLRRLATDWLDAATRILDPLPQ